MAFWKRGGRSQEQNNLNALDRATKSMAVSASRRGFLKKLPALGAGLGLGLTGIRTAFGCTTRYFDPVRDGCCGPQQSQQQWSQKKEVCCANQGCKIVEDYSCSGGYCIS